MALSLSSPFTQARPISRLPAIQSALPERRSSLQHQGLLAVAKAQFGEKFNELWNVSVQQSSPSLSDSLLKSSIVMPAVAITIFPMTNFPPTSFSVSPRGCRSHHGVSATGSGLHSPPLF